MALSEELGSMSLDNENMNKTIRSLETEVEAVRERLNVLETLTGKDSNAIVKKLRDLNLK